MRVELRARGTDGQADEQAPAGRDDAGELDRRTPGPPWIQGVAVPAEPDVLGDVQAGDGLKRAISEREVEDRAGDRIEPREVQLERAQVDERHGHERRQADDERDPRADVDVAIGAQLRDLPRRPSVLERVVRFEGRRGRPVEQLREVVQARQPRRARKPLVGAAVAQVARVGAKRLQCLDRGGDGLEVPVGGVEGTARGGIGREHEARDATPGAAGLLFGRIAYVAGKIKTTSIGLAGRVADSIPPLRRALDRRIPAAGHRERMRFYAQFVSPGDLVFDVGANMGNRTDVFAALGATVVAVEPQAACRRRLAARYAGNPRVHLVDAGLGPAEGARTLYVSSEHTLTTMSEEWIDATRRSGRFAGYSWPEQQTVPITTLDRLIEEHGVPRFCKIDVEGFEVEVLKGLSGPLQVVSLEFASEFLDRTGEALALLAARGASRFNLSHGESYVLALADWVDLATVEAELAALPGLSFGDVYARFA
jgi:FkbM family methyltransferase